MKKGWIKIYRKLKEWEWYKDSHMVHLLIHIVMMANTKRAKWKGRYIERGTFLTGIRSLSKDTGISMQSVRTLLNRMEGREIETLEKNNQYRVVRVINYEEYQEYMKENKKRRSQVKKEIVTCSVEGCKGKIRKEGKCSEHLPMDTKGFVKWTKKSPQSHIQIIGEWADTEDPELKTVAQWEAYMSRHFRVAKNVAKFSREQIEKAYQETIKERQTLDYKPTLDTIFKKLTK